jgi:hypothetical protein
MPGGDGREDLGEGCGADLDSTCGLPGTPEKSIALATATSHPSLSAGFWKLGVKQRLT